MGDQLTGQAPRTGACALGFGVREALQASFRPVRGRDSNRSSVGVLLGERHAEPVKLAL